jgi:predicted phosphodiesterase/biotin operon repressor
MPRGVPGVWPPHDQILAAIAEEGSISAGARRLGKTEPTLRKHLERNGLLDAARTAAQSGNVIELRPAASRDTDPLDEQVRDLIRRKKRISVEALSDALDIAPKRVREALDRLRAQGYRVPDETEGIVELETIVPEKLNLHRSLLEGDTITFGLVSDTHLCSTEEALEQLELAYSMFEQREISEVFHAGDFAAGVGIFRTQVSEIKRHTYDEQVAYLEANFPRRGGITTRGISGNHDVEGDFGRIGANPVVALANRRDDIEFLGDYSAWVELPNGAWLHLLHGKGGMSYAYSYKAQKLVEGYPAGRKPAILAVGHWHVSGWIRQRGVHVLWPGCFEWQSPFLKRLGLSPAVGFWIVTATLGDDGSLVQLRPEWFEFHEGRVVAEAA